MFCLLKLSSTLSELWVSNSHTNWHYGTRCLNTLKNLMAQRRKATRQNTFPFETFVLLQLLTFLYAPFNASFLNFLIFNVLILLHISNLYSPKLVPFSTSHALIMQFGKTKASLLKDHIKGRIEVFHLDFDDRIGILLK